MSGRGVKLIGRGTLPATVHKHPYESGAVEMYDRGRQFLLTGQRVPGTPAGVNDISDALSELHRAMWGAGEGATAQDTGPIANAEGHYAKPAFGPTGLSDDDVLAHCRSDADAEKFVAIYDHADLSSVAGDDSVADYFIWGKLVFYCGDDVERIIALAERGAHFLHPEDKAKARQRKNKWHRRDPIYGTHQRRTIAKLLADRTPDTIFGMNDPAEYIVEGNIVTPRGWGDNSLNSYNSLGAIRTPESPQDEHQESPHRVAPGLEPHQEHKQEHEQGDVFPTDIAPPEPAAYYGLAGDYVEAIRPHTEADPVGVLAQFLTAFGALAGKNACFIVEADRHYPNLFVGIVGKTGRSRKGTSLGIVKARLRAFDAEWADKHILSGLSSGEGVIHAVRNTKEDDAERKWEPLLSEKQMLVVQTELAVVLRMFVRKGNTLVDVLRDAWDGIPLQTLTKNSPERASDYHLSLIGHITQEELNRELTDVEAANGFANRICWIRVQRSQYLPEGGKLSEVDFSKLDKRLAKAVQFAQRDLVVTFDDEARALWRERYANLSDGLPGLAGEITGRAEAQVTRLALIYALLDCSQVIRLPHLRAAFALWDFSVRSVRAIFGDAIGDPFADTILSALRDEYPRGMTRTEISSNLFGRNAESYKLTKALKWLAMANLIRCVSEQTATKPAQRWFAVPPSTTQGGTK